MFAYFTRLEHLDYCVYVYVGDSLSLADEDLNNDILII